MHINFKRITNQLIDLANLKLGIFQSKAKALFEFASYSSIAYFTPLFFVQPQIFLGTVVNSMLICGALYVRGAKLIPLIVLPSIGAISRGFLFGPLSVFLFYMLPFIWISNAILVFSIKAFYLKNKKHFIFGVICSSALKSIFFNWFFDFSIIFKRFFLR